MYQFEPNSQAAFDAMRLKYAFPCNSYTSGHIEIVSLLPTYLPHDNLVYDEKNFYKWS